MNNKLIFIAAILLILQVSINANNATLSNNTNKTNISNISINKLRFVQEENDENKESQADIIFNQAPEGTDKYEEILEGDVFLLNTKTSSVNPAQSDEFQLEYLRLNRHALYYTDKETTYRGVIGAVQLADLLTQGSEGDQVEKGQCCQSITKIVKKQIQFNGDLTETALDCFQLVSLNEKWELCFPQFKQANQWKREITKNIIKQELEKRGIYNFNFITEAPKKVTKYTWLDQASWGGSCVKGLIQSPAKISNAKALQQPTFRMNLDFKVPELSPKAVFDGQQMNIKGDFGTFGFQQDTVLRTYQIQKIQFKFPSEHIVNDVRYDGEMLIFGEKVGGDQVGILSIMIQKNDKGPRNKFIDQLSPETWQLKHEEGKQEFSVELTDATLSLDNIVTDGIKENYRKSFFHYQGSYSDPPCEEGVFRFVMTTPIQVTSTQFESVKIHTYYVTSETNGNARDPIEWDTKRSLYLHVDKSEGCENGLLQQIKEQKKEEEEKIKLEEKIEKEKDECKDIKPKGKFIKATSSVKTYGITDQAKLPTGEFGNGLSVNYVDSSKVPGSTLESLQSKANSVDRKNCQKKRKGKVDLNSLIQ